MELKTEALHRKSSGVAVFLESLLADEYVLCVRTRDARRNVYGTNITQLRKLFGYHCNYLDSVIADISRRVSILGTLVPVTFAHSMEATRLKRHNEKLTGQNQIIEALLDDHEAIIGTLRRESSGTVDKQTDIDTADFMSDLLVQHVEISGALRDWLYESDLEN